MEAQSISLNKMSSSLWLSFFKIPVIHFSSFFTTQPATSTDLLEVSRTVGWGGSELRLAHWVCELSAYRAVCAAGAECTSMWIDWSRLFLGCGTPRSSFLTNKSVAKHWLNGIGFDMTKAFLLGHAVKEEMTYPIRWVWEVWEVVGRLASSYLCQQDYVKGIYFLSLVFDLTGLLVEIGNMPLV